MSGVAITTQLEASAALASLSRLSENDLGQLADEVGRVMLDQTQRRIESEKTAPDGTAWVPWSAAYAERITKGQRGTAKSLLIGQGYPGLLDSLTNASSGMEAVVGSNLIYAAVHQFGSADGGGIPARPYLGISADNAAEIEDFVSTRILELLA